MEAWSCDAGRVSQLYFTGYSTLTLQRILVMADHSEKVKDIIEKELGVEREKLTSEASFIEDLGADSLDIVELVMEFEKEFNIDIPDEDKLRTVGDATKYLNDKIGA
jgi:acyl carrier protein